MESGFHDWLDSQQGHSSHFPLVCLFPAFPAAAEVSLAVAMACLLSVRGSQSSVLGAIAGDVAGPRVLRQCCSRPAAVSCALIPKFPEMAP